MSKTSSAAADIATITQIAKSIQADINTILPIADVPANLALKAREQWRTIREARLIQYLTRFRIDVKNDTGTDLTTIETNLALALADIAEYLGITEPEDLLRILGESDYLAVYVAPIPYQIAQKEQRAQEERAGPRMLAKLKDPTIRKRFNKLREKWLQASKPEAEPEAC